jgi:hypothetical protein
MDIDRRLREDEGESDNGFRASDGDGETGVPITPGNFEISAERVSRTVTIRPKQ